MKHIFIFFQIIIAFPLIAQVSAPGLRCLEVKSNGNVKLTWVSPSDPNNQFTSYRIYFSTSATGPYSLAGSVGALVLTSFTHATALGNTQSLYYFMRTRYTGGGGPDSSATSDTLRTIFVNPLQNVPDVKINYNYLKIPKLNSSSATYTISREYPGGIWNVIGTTSDYKYADTLTVCSASINYQISLQDAQGCISLSNIKGDIFKDTKAPDQPAVDSISVLPNGMTVISWKKPRDTDICKYRIYYKNVTNNAIDSVNGANSTFYTYTVTTANTKAVQLFVAGIDCCGNIGSFNQLPTTIYLTTSYNTCEYSTYLNWTPYAGMPAGLLEYQIYYSVNGGAFASVATTTSTSFVHEGVEPSANICYFIRAFNTSRSVTSSSNRSCFFSTQAAAPAYVYLRNAGVSGKSIQLKIFIDNSKQSSGVDVTRSEDGINFGSIAFLPYNGSQDYSYTDENVNTSLTSYYYKAVLRDSCNNPRVKSNIARTILLKVTDDKENVFVKNLRWNAYRGYDGGVSGYYVYRIVNDAPAGPIGSAGPSDTTYFDNVEDEAPNGSSIKYYVEAVEGISNQYGFLETSRSNTENVYMEGRIFVPTAFAPKGLNKVWLPVTHFVDKVDYSVSVFNRWGAKVFESSDDKQGWDGGSSPPDIYAYLISFKNSRGEYRELKGTVLLLE